MSEYEALKLYDDYLDEIYGVITISIYDYSCSNALKSVDPIAYRDGFLCWCDVESIKLE